MALWICDGCGTPYAVDAPNCPHCGAVEHHGDHAPELVGEAGHELVDLPTGSTVNPKK
jgi:hypothetical protein